MTLLVGVHPNNLHLLLARRWSQPFGALDLRFVPYADGRNSAGLLAEGRIDVCGTGSTPPIVAQADGLAVRYLAASAPRPANGGLAVLPSATVRDVAGLAGKRVALLEGSFHTYLLARELERAGLSLAEIERVELSPPASLAALETGQVDAWVAMAPLLDETLAAGRIRLLARCGDTIPNRSLFWTLRRRQASPVVMDGFVAGLVALGRAIAADPDRAAALLAGEGTADVGRATWRNVVAARDWTIVPAAAAILAEQQDEADTLFRHGALAGAISVLPDGADARAHAGSAAG